VKAAQSSKRINFREFYVSADGSIDGKSIVSPGCQDYRKQAERLISVLPGHASTSDTNIEIDITP
jgi:hypothetical protein